MYELDGKFNGCVKVEGDTIYIAYVKSLEQGKGNFSELIDKYKAKFKSIVVMMPEQVMQDITNAKGFKQSNETIDVMRWERGE